MTLRRGSLAPLGPLGVRAVNPGRDRSATADPVPEPIPWCGQATPRRARLLDPEPGNVIAPPRPAVAIRACTDGTIPSVSERPLLHLPVAILAATLAVVPSVPVAGLALILGIDRFMSEARALTNFIGNGVATLVVSRWEGELDRAALARELHTMGRR